MKNDMESFEMLTEQAIRVRDAVVLAGGMATKSFMEDFMMLHNPGLLRYDAHDVTNHIEYEQKKLVYTQYPELSEYPEVVLRGKVKRAVIIY